MSQDTFPYAQTPTDVWAEILIGGDLLRFGGSSYSSTAIPLHRRFMQREKLPWLQVNVPSARHLLAVVGRSVCKDWKKVLDPVTSPASVTSAFVDNFILLCITADMRDLAEWTWKHGEKAPNATLRAEQVLGAALCNGAPLDVARWAMSTFASKVARNMRANAHWLATICAGRPDAIAALDYVDREHGLYWELDQCRKHDIRGPLFVTDVEVLRRLNTEAPVYVKNNSVSLDMAILSGNYRNVASIANELKNRRLAADCMSDVVILHAARQEGLPALKVIVKHVLAKDTDIGVEEKTSAAWSRIVWTLWDAGEPVDEELQMHLWNEHRHAFAVWQRLVELEGEMDSLDVKKPVAFDATLLALRLDDECWMFFGSTVGNALRRGQIHLFNRILGHRNAVSIAYALLAVLERAKRIGYICALTVAIAVRHRIGELLEKTKTAAGSNISTTMSSPDSWHCVLRDVLSFSAFNDPTSAPDTAFVTLAATTLLGPDPDWSFLRDRAVVYGWYDIIRDSIRREGMQDRSKYVGLGFQDYIIYKLVVFLVVQKIWDVRILTDLQIESDEQLNWPAIRERVLFLIEGPIPCPQPAFRRVLKLLFLGR